MAYTSQYPEIEIDSAVKRFFENFYRISDNPDAHEEYARQFTNDATLVMASKHAKGYQEILALRQGMWSAVAGRKHSPSKVFPFGPSAYEVMLYGKVEYSLKSGGNATVPWAARAILSNESGTMKMSFYQVYLDTAAQNPGKLEK